MKRLAGLDALYVFLAILVVGHHAESLFQRSVVNAQPCCIIDDLPDNLLTQIFAPPCEYPLIGDHPKNVLQLEHVVRLLEFVLFPAKTT